MDELSIAANRTRTLEQEYIAMAFKNHAKQMDGLHGEIARLTAEAANRESHSDDSIGDGAPHGEDLKQMKALEDALREKGEELAAARLKLEAQAEECAALKKVRDELVKRNTALQGKDGKAKKGAVPVLDGDAALADIADTQGKILSAVRDLAQIQSDYRASLGKLEAELEKSRAREKKLDSDVARMRNKQGGTDPGALKMEIAELQNEVASLQRYRADAESANALAERQRDTISLLQDSLASKEKVIERLTDQVERMKKQGPREAVVSAADVIQPQRELPDIFSTGKKAPSSSAAAPAKKPKKETKPVAAKSQTASQPKMVDVKKLFQEDGCNFFNNLSFNNSSPMPDKKGPKPF
ncbi:hypothetical protein PAPHI01_1830 [Pancytospora philotis]|nr:hypothetical protein PAPHI01_1830 [Pancytospora philotis]